MFFFAKKKETNFKEQEETAIPRETAIPETTSTGSRRASESRAKRGHKRAASNPEQGGRAGHFCEQSQSGEQSHISERRHRAGEQSHISERPAKPGWEPGFATATAGRPPGALGAGQFSERRHRAGELSERGMSTDGFPPIVEILRRAKRKSIREYFQIIRCGLLACGVIVEPQKDVFPIAQRNQIFNSRTM